MQRFQSGKMRTKTPMVPPTAITVTAVAVMAKTITPAWMRTGASGALVVAIHLSHNRTLAATAAMIMTAINCSVATFCLLPWRLRLS
jgi:hypothetical protein